MLEIGLAKKEINPKEPERTFWLEPEEPSVTKSIDSLYVRATVFKEKDIQIALVSIDVIGLSRVTTDDIKNSLEYIGFKPGQVAICCTHTHTSPVTVYLKGILASEKYLNFVKQQTVNCVKEALEKRRIAAVGFGKGISELSVNRREIGRMKEVNSLRIPTGLIDPEVGVIKIKHQNDQSESLLVFYTGHPLTLQNPVNVFSADYPGKLTQILEKEFDFAQFFQGCAGNVNIKINGDIHTVVKVGSILAEQVTHIARQIQVQKDITIKMSTDTINLPWDVETLNEKSIIREYPSLSESAANTIVQVVKMNDARIIILPGEPFVEIGLAIKKIMKKEYCFVVGYCNQGEVGYIPVPEAYPEGGYEIEDAYKRYGVYRLGPEASQMLIKKVIDIERREI